MKTTTVYNITSAMVRELRERTGVPLLECKKALVENKGDMDKAYDFLTKPHEEEAICANCWKPLGYKITYYQFQPKDRADTAVFCEDCKKIIEEQQKKFEEQQKKDAKELKQKMKAHNKEMAKLKKEDPVKFMAVHYAVCRDCAMVVQNCHGCSLKFCSICEDRSDECKYCGETKDPALTKFLKQTLEQVTKQQGS